ncbi:MAG: hypothetical protein ABIP13_04180, partial [Tepidiformaceae bacterium]
LRMELASESAAREAVSARPATLADQLFLEAGASDDVTSQESAVDYLELRLAYFGTLLDGAASTAIRARFFERIAAW